MHVHNITHSLTRSTFFPLNDLARFYPGSIGVPLANGVPFATQSEGTCLLLPTPSPNLIMPATRPAPSPKLCPRLPECWICGIRSPLATLIISSSGGCCCCCSSSCCYRRPDPGPPNKIPTTFFLSYFCCSTIFSLFSTADSLKNDDASEAKLKSLDCKLPGWVADEACKRRRPQKVGCLVTSFVDCPLTCSHSFCFVFCLTSAFPGTTPTCVASVVTPDPARRYLCSSSPKLAAMHAT